MKIFCLPKPWPKRGRWFAWRPVWCGRCLVWLETVEYYREDWYDGPDWKYFKLKGKDHD